MTGGRRLTKKQQAANTAGNSITVDATDSKNDIYLPNCPEYKPDDNIILEVQTTAGNAFRNLFDTLKQVLNEANIIFSDKGLKLAAIDTNKHCLVHLFMEAKSFELYHCTQRLVLGIDIEQLHKTIKSNKHNDLMRFVVREDNPSYLEISFENSTKKTKISDNIKLLSLKEYNIAEEIKFQYAAEMDSQDFQNICTQMANIHTTKLEIRVSGDQLIFRNIDGPSTKRTVRVTVSNEDANGNTIQNTLKNEESRGVFSLKFLKSFAKAANLSPTVKIHLQNDHPLICEYSVSGLGSLKYVLSGDEDEVV